MSTRKGGLGRGLDALIPTSVMPTEMAYYNHQLSDQLEMVNIN